MATPVMYLQFKKMFFDRQAVLNATDRARVRALSKFGAFVRRADKSSVKYKKGKSAAGSPPHAHRLAHFKRKKKSKGQTVRQPSSPLRELIFFGYDSSSRSVVIGPAAFKSRLGVGVVPRVVEEGGVGPFVGKGGKVQSAVYKPRPHTGPAFRREIPKLPQMFKDSIKK